MIVGQLREQINLLQESGTTRDDSGAIIPTVTTVGPIYAKVDFLTMGSDERHLADQTKARTSVNFTIRNNPNRVVSKTDQIQYRNQIFEILSVLEHGDRRAYLLIEAVSYE